MNIPSSFLLELPREEMELHQPPGGAWREWDDGVHEEEAWEDDEGELFDELSDDAVSVDVAETCSVADVAPAARLTTAAELLGESTPPPARLSPEEFSAGMIVSHPEHGLGKIVSVSGQGTKRSATIQFFRSDRPRRFVIAHSDLQPVRSPK